MADLPFMQLYVADFEADTAHLNFEEDGAYNRLLRLCWRTSGCSVPDDPIWIARKMRADLETYHRLIEPLIKEFFAKDRGRVFQGRQQREWQRAKQMSDKRVAAGRKGGGASKALITLPLGPSRAQANVKPGLSKLEAEPESESEIYKEPSLGEKILTILGLGLAIPATSVWSELPDCISRWQAEFALEEEEILSIVRKVMSRPNAQPEKPQYFDGAMHDHAMRKMGIKVPFGRDKC